MQLSKEKIEWFRKHPVEAAELYMGIKLPWYQKTFYKFINGSTVICDFNLRRQHRINPEVWEYWKSVIDEINEVEDYLMKEVTITQERYDELLAAELKLMALEGAGVDNWEGYPDAMQMLEEMENENEEMEENEE